MPKTKAGKAKTALRMNVTGVQGAGIQQTSKPFLFG